MSSIKGETCSVTRERGSKASPRRVITIDCDYLYPKFAAAYLLIDGDEAAFIDNNTTHAVPRLMQALHAEGLSPQQVRYVIITHVHLDHAGGTSLLMKNCPQAQLLAHPRAVPHVIDPSKLVSSARKVYGDTEFTRLYGAIENVPAARVTALDDGATVDFGVHRKSLRFLHTRGHANHHFCIQDEATDSIFTGDAFGLCYPALNEGPLFIFPSTSPTDFLASEAKVSINRILNSGAKRAYLTHFGAVTELGLAAEQIDQWIEFSDGLRHQVENSTLNQADATSFCESKIRTEMAQVNQQRGISLSAGHWQMLKLDLELNAQGLAWAGIKAREKKTA